MPFFLFESDFDFDEDDLPDFLDFVLPSLRGFAMSLRNLLDKVLLDEKFDLNDNKTIL